jgi:hypothetical protein
MEICHWWQSYSVALGFSRAHPISYLASSVLEHNREEQKTEKELVGKGTKKLTF